MGTIEKGKIADLDLLNANPLEDIHNTQSLNAVVLGGRSISRSDLDALLAKAENNRWRGKPAGLTLAGLILHQMHKVLYVAGVVLLLPAAGLYYLLRRRRAKNSTTSQTV
jgi:hypothetical protein